MPLSKSLGKAPGERSCTRRLDRRKTGQPSDQTPLPRLPDSFAECRGVTQVAGRENDPVGRLPGKLLQHLQDGRLLPLDSERVDRVEQIDPQFLARFFHQSET